MIQERKTVQLTRQIVIASADAAFEILHDYNTLAVSRFELKYGARDDRETRALAFAAAQYLVQDLRRATRDETLAALGVSADAPAQGPARPTWISQDGTCRYIADMSTTHLVNIARKDDREGFDLPQALRAAIDDELRSRNS